MDQKMKNNMYHQTYGFPHHKKIQTPPIWCTHKGHYSNLALTMSYRKLIQQEIEKCQQLRAIWSATGKFTKTKYKNNAISNTGYSILNNP